MKYLLRSMILMLCLIAIIYHLGFYSSQVVKANKTAEHDNSAFEERPVILSFFGDAMFGRVVGERIKSGLDPFELISTSTIFTTSDAIFLNLEGPITASTTKCQNKLYSFRFEPETASNLKEAGVFGVNLANNHAFDCLEKGRSDTRQLLQKAGIVYFGGSTTTESYTESIINGRKFGLIGIDLTHDYNLSKSYTELAKVLSVRNDFVIVNVHWGEEYRTKPTASQIEAGHKLIDAGAFAVIGHHPHVIETAEIYKGKPILYSLGNFIFDQVGEEQKTGLGIQMTINKTASSTIRLIPLTIDKLRPKLMVGESAAKICASVINTGDNNPCVLMF